jgi:hypothetical protein
MFAFKGMIMKFSSKGEKTGWTYIDIPDDILTKLKRKDKKEFRIKGVIDDVKFDRMATYPVGDGRYIVALNAELRKQLGKKEGAMVSLKIELDASEALQSQELIACLNDDKVAKSQFDTLLLSQRNYFHQYVYSAKGATTKSTRIVNIINAMYKKQNFGEMIRSLKKK